MTSENDFQDDEYEPDEFEEAMGNCHGYFDGDPRTGKFMCGAVGSEDCDACPCYEWLGLTNAEIDALEIPND